ncbi:tyrosine-type recombinase/integrase [Legionella sainthelensi]|uniref:tyrosine-type recombinase/integrase n=1 Tax=Legionella sainthelensi TaxID=28087 RepID=UPI000E1FDC63|nr:integrase arm-type DNA-binding domain-containing protein [Legionella sainthelensi]
MLSDARIKSLKIEDGKRHADRDGLVLELRPSGKKVFLFRFQWSKKPQTITIGCYPSISLSKARELAKTYRDMVNQGIDPRQKYSDTPKKLIFREIAEQWFKKNIHRWKKVTSNRHYKSLVRDIYPFIGEKTIDDVTKSELLAIIHPHELKGHHEVAHRLHNRLKDIFEFAVGASLTENYPFIGLKKVLAPKPRVTNQPSVSPNEAHEMMRIIKKTNSTKIIQLYMELLAHVFTRPSELREARWCEFDLQKAEWNIPGERMKMGFVHWVPLSPHVLSLLKELRIITGFTPFLFTSPACKVQQPISEASVRKLLHNAGFKNRHTAHGFRSLASSVLHEQGNFRSDAIEAQLAHKIPGVRGVYLRADFKAERRALMDWYSNWLLNVQEKTLLKQEVI